MSSEVDTGSGVTPTWGASQETTVRRPRRVRVVLAERSRVRMVPRAATPVEEPAPVDEARIRDLIRRQRRLALGSAAGVLGVLCAVPALFELVPELSDHAIAGVRLPWVLLGALAYPALYAVGVLYVRRAERNERDFTRSVGD
ncbi:MAG TPA: hypothetical protein VIL00_09815 [Pseudonocardiaceae bacterium]